LPDLLTSLADFQHTDGVGPVGGILGKQICSTPIRSFRYLSRSVTGCDLSGIVEEVGSACKTDVRKGDRVFGVCHCANPVRLSLISVFAYGAEALSSNNLKMVLLQNLPW
jgi:hypothetical protein